MNNIHVLLTLMEILWKMYDYRNSAGHIRKKINRLFAI
jgi:hypothetical protein